ncbi:unnamed protein product [Clonostachys chloroleuca]|uniref:Uncharacterized protein n=1 Tax=Clonostachys chloroleuca TaxID=1926264 RepID=A0AA35MH58_9HYPO|nr:unnamed protein product [Clonostachys chloroleuca]
MKNFLQFQEHYQNLMVLSNKRQFEWSTPRFSCQIDVNLTARQKGEDCFSLSIDDSGNQERIPITIFLICIDVWLSEECLNNRNLFTDHRIQEPGLGEARLAINQNALITEKGINNLIVTLLGSQ